MSLLRPLRIGSVRLPNNLVLSPMAGYSDLPFRILCRRHGAGLVCTEMVAADSANRGGAKTLARMRTVEEERPVSIQIFGTREEEVAAAARRAADGCEILGFNMGCPAHQIKAAGCGAAMLDRPDVALAMVRAVKAAAPDRPLLVKIRAGNDRPIDVGRFAQSLEAAGVDGIIFHARTARQGYSGRSDWALIARLKDTVGIPVIGNGDVVDGPSAARALAESGCDGLALGRATLGDPRVFARIAAHLDGHPATPSRPDERLDDLRSYLDLAREHGVPRSQILAQVQRFTKGLPGAARLRDRLRCGDEPTRLLADVERHVRELAVV
ncbi:MAG TPA: tRNA-dihydrouridine synthase family protein [Candidatus Thermoplasmatota archaeon]|nr:tRNA-dihydrouridine synthase family protein [Candidatus Thermoplasmatota archaeon]